MSINPYLDQIRPFFGLEENVAGRLERGPRILKLRKEFAWAIPSDDGALAIARHAASGIVEVGAGSGYWKWFLEQFGVNVSAFDIGAISKRWAAKTYAEVAEGGPEVAQTHAARTLLIVKPIDTTDPEEDGDLTKPIPSFAVEAFRQYRAAGGSCLIHVGHPYYTPGDRRVSRMSAEERILGKTYVYGEGFPENWKLAETVELPTYDDKGYGPECVFVFTKTA